MQCPSCNSDQTQRLEVIYENGTQDINTTTTSVGVGSGGRGFGLGTASSRTTGKSQSLAAQRLAPPPKKTLGGSIAAVIGGLLVAVNGSGGFAFFGLLVLALGGYLGFRAVKYNGDVWPGLYQTWLSSWYCNKCGTVYQQ